MANLSLKNVPDELVERLRERAKRNRRSLNREAVLCLEQVVGREENDVQAILARLDELHAGLDMPPLTDDFINETKREGRP